MFFSQKNVVLILEILRTPQGDAKWLLNNSNIWPLNFHWWPLHSWSLTLINGCLWVLESEVKVVRVKWLGSDPYPHPGSWSICLPLAPTLILGRHLTIYLVPICLLSMTHSPISPIHTPGPHTHSWHTLYPSHHPPSLAPSIPLSSTPIHCPYSFTPGINH